MLLHCRENDLAPWHEFFISLRVLPVYRSCPVVPAHSKIFQRIGLSAVPSYLLAVNHVQAGPRSTGIPTDSINPKHNDKCFSYLKYVGGRARPIYRQVVIGRY